MKKNTLRSLTTARTCSLQAPVENAAHGIISRAVLTAPALRLTLFHFAGTQELSEHTGKACALVQILSGAREFAVGPARRTLRPGDWQHLPRAFRVR